LTRSPNPLRRILCILLAGTGLLAVPAAAEPKSGFAGTWRTVDAESESMDPVMKAQGIPWLQRKAARIVTLEFVFRQDGNDMEQEMDSRFVSKSKRYRMNGPEYDDEDFRGRKIRSRDWWTDSGDFMRRMEYESGMVLTVHRNLRDDGRHIDVLFEIERPGHDLQTVRRVLRRVDEAERES
jgi:hypothetical protein